MSIMSSLYISQQALQNNQAALAVVSNNISNMNTDGYSKESVRFATVSNGSSLNNSAMSQISKLGGAQISQVVRNRDAYLDSYYREQNSKVSYSKEASTEISLVENLTNELNSTGLSSSLSTFYNDADKLAASPTDSALRKTYAQDAQSVCDKFNYTSNELKSLRSSLVGDPSDTSTYANSKIKTTVDELNTDLQKLADLNQKISEESAGDQAPNALLDQRDQLLDEISSYAPISTVTAKDNTITLSINGVQMVKGSELKGTIKIDIGAGTASNPAVLSVYDSKNNKVVSNINSAMNSGEIGAILDVAGPNGSIQTTLDSLDKMASEFAKTLNGIQTYTDSVSTPTQKAMCIDNTTTPPTLKVATASMIVDKNDPTNASAIITAGNISVSGTILSNPYEIATAITKLNATDPTKPLDPSATGNNNAISQIANLRNNGIAALGNATLTTYMSNIAIAVGVQSSNAQSNYTAQESVKAQASTLRSSKTGVNLDEELIDLTKYQRSYEASAKVFNTTNSILETLMNLAR